MSDINIEKNGRNQLSAKCVTIPPSSQAVSFTSKHACEVHFEDKDVFGVPSLAITADQEVQLPIKTRANTDFKLVSTGGATPDSSPGSHTITMG